LCAFWLSEVRQKIAALKHPDDSSDGLETEAFTRAWTDLQERTVADGHSFQLLLLSYAEDQPMQRYIRMAREGDQDAFARIWQYYRTCVRNALVFRIVPVSDADAEDLQDTTWLKTWCALEKYVPARPFKHFLLTVAMNEKRSWLRKQRAAETRSMTGEDGAATLEIPVAPSETALTPVLDEMLRIVLSDTEHPNRALAFGLVRYLQVDPDEVIANYSSTSLHNLAGYLEQQLGRVFAPFLRLDEAIRPLKQALREPAAGRHGSVGETTLADYYRHNPRRDLAQWTEAEFRRVWSEVKRSENVLLRLMFDGPEPPHECLTHAASRLLRWTLERLWQTSGEQALVALAGHLELSYSQVSSLAPKLLRACMRRLWENLDASVNALVRDRALRARLQPHWQSCAGELALADYAGSDAPAILAQWYANVERRVAGDLRSHPRARACACFCGPEADRLRLALRRCAGLRRA
jgi:DNA-directed RNA polymerase specialized sigma24 family protein